MPSWEEALAADAAARPAEEFTRGKLSDEYVQPPYTVLDSRKGDWQARRRAWLTLGIRSELGRGEAPDEGSSAKIRQRRGTARAYSHDMMKGEGTNVSTGGRTRRDAERASNLTGQRPNHLADQVGLEHMAPGTSIFDPVLCELAYRWWAPAGGTILDPFAGGSVRGIVAAILGHPYTGVELRPEQVASNREQAAAILPPGVPQPEWIVGDATQLHDLLPAGAEYDMVLTCPPYYDLEVYSDDPRDLSAQATYAGFLGLYQQVAQASVARLRPGRYAVWVVSEVRDPAGHYLGLVPDTIGALVGAGTRLYNEAILVNAVGSGALRAQKTFNASRKLIRLHQNVLVFVKGTPARGWDHARPAPPDPQLDLSLDMPAPLLAAPAPAIDAPPPLPAPAAPPLELAPPQAPQAPQAPDPAPAPAQVPPPLPAAPVAGPVAPQGTVVWLAQADVAQALADAQAMVAWWDQHPDPRSAVPDGDRLGHEHRARCAELAVATYLGVPARPYVVGTGNRGQPDVGSDIEVRSSVLPTARLRVYGSQARGRRYVLAIGTGAKWCLAGWLYGYEAQAPVWRDAGAARPCYMVPQEALRPIGTLKPRAIDPPLVDGAAPRVADWVCDQCHQANAASAVVPLRDSWAHGRGMCYTCDDHTAFTLVDRP